MDPAVLMVVGLIGLTALVIDGILLKHILDTRRKVPAVRTWPNVTGTVLTSHLEARRSSDNGRLVNYPVVSYQYEVNGRGYENNRVAAGMEIGGSSAPAVVARYPTASKVAVFYNPDDPSDSVLETKTPFSVYLLWFALFMATLLTCGMSALFLFVN